MARQTPRKFYSEKTVYARRAFTCGGRHYERGDLFDWRRLSISERKATVLFDSGRLIHEKPSVAEKIEKITKEVDVVDDREKDYLDDIDDMKELRKIADEMDVGYKVSKADQRQVIRDALNGELAATQEA